MRGLTPEEFAELSRLLLPVGTRSVAGGSREWAMRMDFVEQGRATRTDYAEPVPNELGGSSRWRCDITPSGREALALYPLMLALQAPARSAP